MANITDAAAAVEDGAAAYRPMHQQVRETEAHIREIDIELDELETTARRAEDGSARKSRAEEQIAELTAEREELLTKIPAEWDAQYETFSKLTSAETNARRTYRRTADNAYSAIPTIINVVGDEEALRAFGDTMRGVKDQVTPLEPKEAEAFLKEIEKQIGAIEGTSETKKLLAKARREVKKKNGDPDKAAEFLDDALVAYDEDLAWRAKAKTDLLPELTTYREAIKDTIGLRGQDRLPREQALFVASCSSGHRDISLNF